MGLLLGVVEVELVNGDGFGLRDLMVPGLTLVGALLGVVIGGRINRATLNTLEQQRDARERELSDFRLRHEVSAERRRARGAAVVLHRDLTQRALLLERLREDFHMARPENQPLSLGLHPDDQALLAAWLTDACWAQVSEARALLDHLEWDSEPGRPLTELVELDQIGDALGAIADATDRLESEAIPALSDD